MSSEGTFKHADDILKWRTLVVPDLGGNAPTTLAVSDPASSPTICRSLSAIYPKELPASFQTSITLDVPYRPLYHRAGALWSSTPLTPRPRQPSPTKLPPS